jgi:hypothetical protein
MTRTLRPIGKVSAALGRLGFRQYAAIFVDGKQVPNVAVLSTKDGDKLKFVGHWIDGNGEVHTTKPMVDMKRAANRIMGIIEQAPAPAPAPKRRPPAKKAAERRHSEPSTVHSIGAEIMCKGCGTRHSDDTMCPE